MREESLRTAVVMLVALMGVASLVAAWGVSVAFRANDSSKSLFQVVFVVCAIAWFILAALIWRRDTKSSVD